MVVPACQHTTPNLVLCNISDVGWLSMCKWTMWHGRYNKMGLSLQSVVSNLSFPILLFFMFALALLNFYTMVENNNSQWHLYSYFIMKQQWCLIVLCWLFRKARKKQYGNPQTIWVWLKISKLKIKYLTVWSTFLVVHPSYTHWNDKTKH